MQTKTTDSISANNATLLLVDDNLKNLDMLSRRLQRRGYNTLLATSGEDGLTILSQYSVDLMILDVMMPGLSGIDVLNQIREHQDQHQLPIIMATAKSQSEDISSAFEQGANDYITKPVDFKVALARIESCLNQKQLSDALEISQERYQLAVQGANDGIWDWDLTSDEIFFSSRWKSILGYADDELEDSPNTWLDKIHPRDRAEFHTKLDAHIQGQDDLFDHRYRMLHKNGEHRWVETRGVAIFNASGMAVRMAGSQTDITPTIIHDNLTQLPTQTLFMDRLESTLLKAKRSQELFGILFIDVVHFKVINDCFGYQEGDKLLNQIARRIEDSTRKSDTVSRVLLARFCSDEFPVLLHNLKHHEDAYKVADRIHKTFKKPFQIQGQDIYLGVKIGITTNHKAYLSAADMVHDASLALSRAKEQNTHTEVFDYSMQISSDSRLRLENDLVSAVHQDEFVLNYQPIIALNDDRVIGFESLIRWQHPKRGWVSPIDFIPLAEQNGFIKTIDHWVLNESCKTLKKWISLSPTNPPVISVNISGHQFIDEAFYDYVQQCLSLHTIPAQYLQLEITESLLIEHFNKATKILDKLTNIGVKVALDDFGTGYSSLSYLCHFTSNTLKIDRSFISNITDDKKSKIIVQNTVNLANELEVKVVAEGIETEKEKSMLIDMNCAFGQGFLFAKPLSEMDAKTLLLKGSVS